MTTATDDALELDHRAGDGLEVWLLWTPSTERLCVVVHDETLDETFEVEVEHGDALDAFRHPYAYAAFRRVRYRSPLPLAA